MKVVKLRPWTRRLKWVEFVVGSRPCSEGFSPGYPVFLPPQKPTLQIPIRSGNEDHRINFLLAPVEGLFFQTKISGKYIVLVLISLLFYFFSSLRRGNQSTVF